MGKKKAEKLRVMMKTDGFWTVWRFEFDVTDGRGVAWHNARGTGSENSIEKSTGHFIKKGYAVIPWEDV